MRGQLEYPGNSDLGDPTRPTKRQKLGHLGRAGLTSSPHFSHKQISGRQSLSSPRRLSTPVPPDRLTFPPDHQEPNLSRSDDGYQNGTVPQNERPGTSRFKQFVRQCCHTVNLYWFTYRKYTYNPPETLRSRQQVVGSHDQTRIPHPGQSSLQQRQTHRSHHHGHGHAHTHHTHKHHKVMPPPPTPRSHPAEMPHSSTIHPHVSASESAPSSSMHLVPANKLPFQRSVLMTPTNAPHRFVPPPSVSRLNTAANRHSASQGHRMPFIPNGA